MITHLRIWLDLGCVTSVSLTIHPHCPHCCCVVIEAFRFGIRAYYIKVKVHCLPICVMVIFAQYKYDPKMKAVNGQITEVKQSRPRIILRWLTI